MLFLCDKSLLFAEGQLAADGLGVRKAVILFLEPVGDHFQALGLSVKEKVGQEEPQGDVIVCESL